tara:strand:+ start:319 stop:462 length:144 start_codon:yes stop_codon:yes gene_type:complete
MELAKKDIRALSKKPFRTFLKHKAINLTEQLRYISGCGEKEYMILIK